MQTIDRVLTRADKLLSEMKCNSYIKPDPCAVARVRQKCPSYHAGLNIKAIQGTIVPESGHKRTCLACKRSLSLDRFNQTAQ